MLGTYLNQKWPFTGVYSCLQKNCYSWVFFLTKFQTYSLKKDSNGDVYCEFSEYFRTLFLGNTFRWWLLLPNTIFFVASTSSVKSSFNLSYFLIIFKYFQSKHFELLVNSCFGEVLDNYTFFIINTFISNVNWNCYMFSFAVVYCQRFSKQVENYCIY